MMEHFSRREEGRKIDERGPAAGGGVTFTAMLAHAVVIINKLCTCKY